MNEIAVFVFAAVLVVGFQLWLGRAADGIPVSECTGPFVIHNNLWHPTDCECEYRIAPDQPNPEDDHWEVIASPDCPLEPAAHPPNAKFVTQFSKLDTV